jgi:hypothetical protein
MKSSILLSSLSRDVENILQQVQNDFTGLSHHELNVKENAHCWSVLECFEHLNRYSRFYHAEFERAVASGIKATADGEVKSSWLGKKFIDMMRPQNQKKQKTFKQMNPANSILNEGVLEEFIQHQQNLRSILQQAQNVDLVKTTVRVEFLRLLKMNLGDGLQFIAVHLQRHMLQAQRTRAALSKHPETFLKV